MGKKRNPFRMYRNIERGFYREMMFRCVYQRRLHDLDYYADRWDRWVNYSWLERINTMTNILDEITNEYGVSILYELRDDINNDIYATERIFHALCKFLSNYPSSKINDKILKQFIMEYRFSN